MSRNINMSSGFQIGAAGPVDERYIFQTIQERDAYNLNLFYHGLLCYVIEKEQHYTYKGNGIWQESIGNASLHISENAPENKNLMWVTSVDDFVPTSSDPVMDEFRKTLQALTAKVDDIQSRFDHTIDPGVFPIREEEQTRTLRQTPRFQTSRFHDDLPPLPPGSNLVTPSGDPDPEAPLPPGSNLPPEAEPQPNANVILVKRGYKSDLPILHDGELGYCKDTKELYVGANGRLVLLNGEKSGGSENITAEYIDLQSPSKKTYRLSVTDQGLLQILDVDEWTKPDPEPEEAPNWKGLVINSVYGGGAEGANNTAVSHGYIELYNKTMTSLSLKGLSVHYGEFGKPWRTLNLFGTVPPQTSFLIRCARHTDSDNENLKYEITEYDMEWNIPLIDAGMKVYLNVGRGAPRSANPYHSTGTSDRVYELGYIDLLGAAGEDITMKVDGYEKGIKHILNRNTAARRNDFADVDDNAKDIVAFDFSTATPAQVQTYRPRSLKDGVWDIYFDKTQMDKTKPNMMVLGFGQDAHTTRTFSWQTIRTQNQQFVWYRKVGQSNWTQTVADRRPVQYPDIDSYIWNCIVRNLTPGDYEYKVGEPERADNTQIISDVYTFKIKTQQELSQSMTFLQITDQQGVNAFQYQAWNKAADYILKNETFDWVLNTGVTCVTTLKAPLIA